MAILTGVCSTHRMKSSVEAVSGDCIPGRHVSATDQSLSSAVKL